MEDSTALGEISIERWIRPSGARIPFGSPHYAEIVDFLNDEARLLDTNRFEEWLSLLDDELLYIAPVRESEYRRDGSGIDLGMRHFDDDHASMRLRVRRLTETQSAFAEDPPSRTRRIVSNVAVFGTGSPEGYEVISNIVVFRNRGSSAEFEIISAARYDYLRYNSSGLAILRRCIILDQATLGLSNLGIFL